MSDISEAAREFGCVNFKPSSSQEYAHAAQALIDEAVRRAREERTKARIKELEEMPRPELAPVPSSPPDEGRPLTDPLRAPDMVYVMVTRQGDPITAGRSRDEIHLTDRDIRMGYRLVEYVRADAASLEAHRYLNARIVEVERERDEARAEVERLTAELEAANKHVEILRFGNREAHEELVRLREQAKQRPAMGPIPDEVVRQVLQAARLDLNATRAALDAVRMDLCQYEVVQTAHPMWIDSLGRRHTELPGPDWVRAYGPFTPVFCVRDPSREVLR